jgi:hypothetical protein
MAELAGRAVQIRVGGTPVSMTDEPTAEVGGDDRTYEIVNTAKQVIDWNTPVVVEEGGVATTESYHINHVTGRIIFDTADAGRGAVTVTGKYVPMSVAGYGESYGAQMTCDMLAADSFGATHKNRIAGLPSASGTLTNIDVTDSMYVPALAAGPVVLEIASTSGALPNRYLAMLDGVEDSMSVDAIQKRTIGWVSRSDYMKLGV